MKPETMMIDDVKYVREDKAGQQIEEIAGDYVVVRCDRAGVFAGVLVADSEKGQECTLLRARRLWYWSGAASLSQLATEGTKKPDECKFPRVVPSIRLKDVIEIIPCTDKAKKSIEGVKVWAQ